MIVHILEKHEWEQAKKEGAYKADSLEKQGFIHCSVVNQIIRVANYNYKNKKDMLMLVIDENLIKSKVIYEDLYNEGIKFPHIYGAINIDSVVEIIDFPCSKDGTFDLPLEAIKYLT